MDILCLGSQGPKISITVGLIYLPLHTFFVDFQSGFLRQQLGG